MVKKRSDMKTEEKGHANLLADIFHLTGVVMMLIKGYTLGACEVWLDFFLKAV